MDNTNQDDLWAKYRQMISATKDSTRVNQAGKKFVSGCERYLELQGYLSPKQVATLTLIYEQSLEP